METEVNRRSGENKTKRIPPVGGIGIVRLLFLVVALCAVGWFLGLMAQDFIRNFATTHFGNTRLETTRFRPPTLLNGGRLNLN